MEREIKYLEGLIRDLVDYPEDIRVERSVDNMGILLSLYIHPEDMGQIIGRKGETARAVRTLLRVFGMRNQARVSLRIVEPQKITIRENVNS
jgi:uncharacterized protein